MGKALVTLALCMLWVSSLPALPAQPQRPAVSTDPAVGNWRGTIKSAAGPESPIIISIVKKGDGYSGSTNGLNATSDVPLTRVTVDGARFSIEASSESRLGDVVLTCELTAEGSTAKGAGTLAVGAQKFDVTLTLQRRNRADVVQPRVEQRAEYFVGRWKFDYLGGEFPPLSVGGRSGTITFTRAGSSGFVKGQLEGDLVGKRYEETWSLGFDPETKTVVLQERRTDGTELLSVGNWRSPIAISFLTSPVQANGKTYQLRRLLSVTSDVAFEVTEEFSVDGGPFRRLGNGHFTKQP